MQLRTGFSPTRIQSKCQTSPRMPPNLPCSGLSPLAGWGEARRERSKKNEGFKPCGARGHSTLQFVRSSSQLGVHLPSAPNTLAKSGCPFPHHLDRCPERCSNLPKDTQPTSRTFDPRALKLLPLSPSHSDGLDEGRAAHRSPPHPPALPTHLWTPRPPHLPGLPWRPWPAGPGRPALRTGPAALWHCCPPARRGAG